MRTLKMAFELEKEFFSRAWWNSAEFIFVLCVHNVCVTAYRLNIKAIPRKPYLLV